MNEMEGDYVRKLFEARYFMKWWLVVGIATSRVYREMGVNWERSLR
jgi:hypothetical protein